MITETMTVQEIRKEFLKDIPAVNRKLHYTLFPKIASLALHSSKFPVCTTCRYISPERKNRFFLKCTAYKRSDHDSPKISITGIYNRTEGKYAINISEAKDSDLYVKATLIFSPHFFSRYRERFLKDNSLTNDDVIETYLKRNSGIMITRMNEKFAPECKKYEEEGSVITVGRIADGNVIAKTTDNTIIVLTFLADDMLHDNQKEAFGELEKNHEIYLTKRLKH